MMTPEQDEFFRASAGAAVISDEGKVLALERADLPGRWQLPQGGIRAGEEPVAAAYRELREETGLGSDEVDLIAEVPGWLAYELPPAFRSDKVGLGQVQKWFIFRLKDKRPTIRFDAYGASAEFKSWKWMSPGDLVDEVVEFRRDVYKRIADMVTRIRGDED